MADYTITASNVVPGDTTGTIGVAGEAIAAGEAVYKKAADGKYYKAQNDGTAEEADFAGIAVNSAPAADLPFMFKGGGTLTCGSAFTAAGAVIGLSANAGKIAPIADSGSGKRVVIVGFSNSATVLQINKVNPLVSVP